MPKMKRKILCLKCECGSSDHLATFEHFEDDDVLKEIYLSVSIDHQPFFRRLWRAIKHVWGYKLGYWTEIIINKSDAERLQKYLNNTIPKMRNTSGIDTEYV